MYKTSLYLTPEERDGLRRLAAATGRSQSQLAREAITEYVTRNAPKRRFLSDGAGNSGRGGKSSIADEDIDQMIYEMLVEDMREQREWKP
jgi:predicted transcriptional regulator